MQATEKKTEMGITFLENFVVCYNPKNPYRSLPPSESVGCCIVLKSTKVATIDLSRVRNLLLSGQNIQGIIQTFIL